MYLLKFFSFSRSKALGIPNRETSRCFLSDESFSRRRRERSIFPWRWITVSFRKCHFQGEWLPLACTSLICGVSLTTSYTPIHTQTPSRVRWAVPTDVASFLITLSMLSDGKSWINFIEAFRCIKAAHAKDSIYHLLANCHRPQWLKKEPWMHLWVTSCSVYRICRPFFRSPSLSLCSTHHNFASLTPFYPYRALSLSFSIFFSRSPFLPSVKQLRIYIYFLLCSIIRLIKKKVYVSRKKDIDILHDCFFWCNTGYFVDFGKCNVFSAFIAYLYLPFSMMDDHSIKNEQDGQQVEPNLSFVAQNETVSTTTNMSPPPSRAVPTSSRPSTLQLGGQRLGTSILLTPNDYNKLLLSTPELDEKLRAYTIISNTTPTVQLQTPDLINAIAAQPASNITFVADGQPSPGSLDANLIDASFLIFFT